MATPSSDSTATWEQALRMLDLQDQAVKAELYNAREAPNRADQEMRRFEPGAKETDD